MLDENIYIIRTFMTLVGKVSGLSPKSGDHSLFSIPFGINEIKTSVV